MNILIDADACPVKEIAVDIAKRENIPVVMICDTSHILKSDYAEVITVDKAADSVDIRLANLLKKGDIAITQDYGVAAMALSKGGFAINQNGLVYDDSNTDRLLFERHIGKKLRKSGRRSGSVPKRSVKDDENFRMNFENLIKKVKLSEKS